MKMAVKYSNMYSKEEEATMFPTFRLSLRLQQIYVSIYTSAEMVKGKRIDEKVLMVESER